MVWLVEGSEDTAARGSFLGVVKEKHTILQGKVVGVAADGKGLTLEVPPPRDSPRGAEPKRVDVKLTDKTNLVYYGIGPAGAKPAEGYGAWVMLEDGSTEAAAQVGFFGSHSRR